MTSIGIVHLGHTIVTVADDQVTGEERPFLSRGEKVFQVGRWIIGVAGTAQGRDEIHRRLKAETSELTIDDIAATMRDLMGWYQTGEPVSELLVAGLHAPSDLYLVNYRGAIATTRDRYLCLGSGSAYMLGVLDAEWERGQGGLTDEGMVNRWGRALKLAVTVAGKRDIYTGATHHLHRWS